MKLIYRLHIQPDGQEKVAKFIEAIELPKGCGIDHAAAEIERVIGKLKELSLELHKAHTEGRKIDPQFLARFEPPIFPS